ncbi:hypothetical protein EXIGLDRAFT_731709 [Exidia glandulosa HHB12029]|uniref:F-box domain-containing protein n=1 Tax=Exidia glandulosa HHB12029 TaxID=1314781 RepID=A0A165BRU9_EXIGL|nr:hypothetical protein EXIGLDRAFT_731709 [Exidia glandulosa HHB12029]
MSSAARSQQLARMRADEDFLALTDARIDALRRADSAAQERLAIAQAEADATRAELTALEVRQLQLRSDIGQMRLDHRRMLWTQAIPLDCLRQIFEEATSIPTAEWAAFGDGGYSRKCIMAPFALAAVCARWRQLALGVPVLWTYICAGRLRPGQSIPPATLSRIRCLLNRSSNAPFDIRFQLKDCPPETLTDVSVILAMIASHARRIRSIDLWLPKGIDREPALDVFRAPLPLLTHLCIIAQIGELEGCDSYLPYAPKLLHLELQATGITCAPQHQIFGSIRSLTLWTPYPSAQVATILRCVSETVEQLHVASVRMLSGIRTPITFPRLYAFSMAHASSYSVSPDIMVAPRLQALTIPGIAMSESAAHLVESVGSNISSLTLADPDIPAYIPRLLQGLRQVETLRFLVSGQHPEYTVSDEFFIELATASPTIWPKLRSIHLDDCESSKPLGDGLVKLIRARNFPAADTMRSVAPEERPCRLKQVEAPGAPSWLRSSIEHLLSRS